MNIFGRTNAVLTRAHVRFFTVTIKIGGLLNNPVERDFPHAKLITFPFSMF